MAFVPHDIEPDDDSAEQLSDPTAALYVPQLNEPANTIDGAAGSTVRTGPSSMNSRLPAVFVMFTAPVLTGGMVTPLGAAVFELQPLTAPK